MARDDRPPNRLAGEASLYLRQHASNPVDWFPWGEEAFSRARELDRPIFLSIGYSTCHWCHVMERESFEDPRLAGLLNDGFVCVKVDREERPDVDQVYMTALHLMGEDGGWPLTMFLTPDLQPFYGGTYFPPVGRHGRPGLEDVLQAVTRGWHDDRSGVVVLARRAKEALERIVAERSPATLDRSLVARFKDAMAGSFDRVHGGFGSAPKFPRSHALDLILRHHAATGDPEALRMVETTLDAMAGGGIHDHLAGGFHRYATDRAWRVPHFEKMLYDNALLARTYVEAYRATGNRAHADVARSTLDWVLAEMRHPGGAFHSATDADSEGVEGRYFVWTPGEVASVLGEEDGLLFSHVHGVTAEGNFEDGRSILYRARPVEDVARKWSLDPADLRARLERSRRALYEARKRRVPPARDEKVVTAWSSLTVSALAAGYRALRDPRYARAAVEAGRFLVHGMTESGVVYRRWIDGQRAHPGVLEDYGALACACLDLYEAVLDARWVDHALELARSIESRLAAPGGGFLDSAPRPDLLVATREPYDGATPSGNSLAAMAMARLGVMTQDPRWTDHARRALASFSGALASNPAAHPGLISVLDFLESPPTTVVLAGEAPEAAPAGPGAPAFQGFVEALGDRHLPNVVLMAATAGAEVLEPVRDKPRHGRARAYVCAEGSCRPPVETAGELLGSLGASVNRPGHDPPATGGACPGPLPPTGPSRP